MTKLKISKGKQKTTRRVLAAFCAVCIAVLQCFVVIPAVTDGAHASENVTFRASYSTGLTVAQDDKNWITGAKSKELEIAEIPDAEGNPSKVKGYQLSSILKKANLDNNNGVYVAGGSVGDPSKAYLVKIDGDWLLYDDGTLYGDVVDQIEANLDKEPIRITKASSSKKNPYKGDKVTITYKLEVDDFYKNSDEFKDNKEDILELKWTASNSKVSPGSTTTNDASGSFTVTVKESGKVVITPEATDSDFTYLNDGSHAVTLSGKSPKLTVKPKSISMSTGEFKSCSVKYNGSAVTNSSCSWSSSKSSVASVTSGSIRALTAGKTTITVKYKGQTATVSVTVKQKQTSSYSHPGGYTPYRTSTRSGLTNRTTGTGATTASTATRPTETISTAAPSFQTMSVKEVYLTPISQDPYMEEGSGDEWDDEFSEEEGDTEEDFDEDGVPSPAAAGSAAAAAAVCGAGVVGRVRKFHIDMGDFSSAKDAAAGGNGSGSGGEGSGTDSGSESSKGSEKASRNPLKRFRK